MSLRFKPPVSLFRRRHTSAPEECGAARKSASPLFMSLRSKPLLSLFRCETLLLLKRVARRPMRLSVHLLSLLVFLTVASTTQAAGQGYVGDFTKSPTEHVINQIEKPFVVSSVSGTISVEGNSDPLPIVLFEIQGPGDDKTIARASSDKHGKFKIGHVKEGSYKFKATLNGFQSVMGTIIVSKAGRHDKIKIEMPLGV